MYKNYEDKLNTILSNAKGEKVEKYSLKDIKTLDKLTGQLKTLTDKLDDSKIKTEVSSYDRVNQLLKDAEAQLDRAEDSLRISKEKIQKAEQDFAKDEKAYLKVEKKFDTARNKQEKAAQKVFKLNDKYIADYKKAENVADKLEDAISIVEKNAKSLGVKVNVSQYETIINNFNKKQNNPLNKIDFDY